MAFPYVRGDDNILFNDEGHQALVLRDNHMDGRGYTLVRFSRDSYLSEAGQSKTLFNEFMRNYSRLIEETGKVQFINAIRIVGEYEQDSSHHKVSNSLVNDIMNFRDGDRSKREKFNKIKEFIRNLTFPTAGKDQFELIIPRRPGKNIFYLGIEDRGRVLPLENFGSGVEQVVSMVVNLMKNDQGKIVLLEEPEVHLHPGLQKAFIKFLINDLKENQYFIASHSSTFIDKTVQSEGDVFIVDSVPLDYTLTGSDKIRYSLQSRVKSVDEEGLYTALELIGASPSDILQANGIIWVEGISDKLYIQHWLNLYCAKKGITLDPLSYEVMFYGGSMLSNIDFTLNDDQWNQVYSGLVRAEKINRNNFVLMDRDNFLDDGDNTGKEKTKKDLVNTVGSDKSWVTQKKEIEFYLPPAELAEIIDAEDANKLKSNLSKKELAQKMIEKYITYEDWFRMDNDLELQLQKLLTNIQKWSMLDT